MLTTQFEDKMVHVGKNDQQGNKIMKPVAVMHYNESMGPIDKTDMLLSSVECVRRTIKWYKKLFFHLIDLSLLNAYSAYKTCTGLKISLADFQFQLIREIFKKYAKQKQNICRRSNTCFPERLQGRHFPSTVPPTSKKVKPQRKCLVCQNKYNKRKDTTYMCIKCDVGLCPVPCFEIYHTQFYHPYF